MCAIASSNKRGLSRSPGGQKKGAGPSRRRSKDRMPTGAPAPVQAHAGGTGTPPRNPLWERTRPQMDERAG